MKKVVDICAVDIGQTSLRYLIWQNGVTICSGSIAQGFRNILLPGALDAFKRTLDELVKQIHSNQGDSCFRVVAVGCTGIAKERRNEYTLVFDTLSQHFPNARIVLENDILVSHIAHFSENPGIILHAGTGAFAFGRDRYGSSLRTGGWGYLLGDEGAGFGLGLAAIRTALQAWEQTGPHSSLKDELLPYFGISKLVHLKTAVYSHDFQPGRIAGFTKILFQHANQGDPVATQIVEDGAKQIVKLITPLLKHLNFEKPTIAMTGALFTNSSAYYQRCRRELFQCWGRRVQIIPGTRSILDGALCLGMKYLQSLFT